MGNVSFGIVKLDSYLNRIGNKWSHRGTRLKKVRMVADLSQLHQDVDHRLEKIDFLFKNIGKVEKSL